MKLYLYVRIAVTEVQIFWRELKILYYKLKRFYYMLIIKINKEEYD